MISAMHVVGWGEAKCVRWGEAVYWSLLFACHQGTNGDHHFYFPIRIEKGK